MFGLLLRLILAMAANDRPSPDPASLVIPPEQLARAETLVRQLGSMNYPDRERATRELRRMGRLALPALIAAKRDDDPEVRMRAERLFPGAESDDLRARLDTFIADTESQYFHDLPGWERFRLLAGQDASARLLFADVVRQPNNKALLEALRGIPRETANPLGSVAGGVSQAGGDTPQAVALSRVILARRYFMFMQSQVVSETNGGRAVPPELSEVALLMAAECLVPDHLIPAGGFQYLVNSSFYTKDGRDAAAGNGEFGPAFRQLCIMWIMTRETPGSMQVGMAAAKAIGYDATVIGQLAARMLASPTATYNIKLIAIEELIRNRATNHLVDIERLFDDESPLVRRAQGIDPVQLRDAALAGAIELTGQSISEYGLVPNNGGGGFRGRNTSQGQYRFESDDDGTSSEKREAAFTQWRQWEASVFGSTAGPAAAITASQRIWGPNRLPK